MELSKRDTRHYVEESKNSTTQQIRVAVNSQQEQVGPFGLVCNSLGQGGLAEIIRQGRQKSRPEISGLLDTDALDRQ